MVWLVRYFALSGFLFAALPAFSQPGDGTMTRPPEESVLQSSDHEGKKIVIQIVANDSKHLETPHSFLVYRFDGDIVRVYGIEAHQNPSEAGLKITFLGSHDTKTTKNATFLNDDRPYQMTISRSLEDDFVALKMAAGMTTDAAMKGWWMNYYGVQSSSGAEADFVWHLDKLNSPGDTSFAGDLVAEKLLKTLLMSGLATPDMTKPLSEVHYISMLEPKPGHERQIEFGTDSLTIQNIPLSKHSTEHSSLPSSLSVEEISYRRSLLDWFTAKREVVSKATNGPQNALVLANNHIEESSNLELRTRLRKLKRLIPIVCTNLVCGGLFFWGYSHTGFGKPHDGLGAMGVAVSVVGFLFGNLFSAAGLNMADPVKKAGVPSTLTNTTFNDQLEEITARLSRLEAQIIQEISALIKSGGASQNELIEILEDGLADIDTIRQELARHATTLDISHDVHRRFSLIDWPKLRSAQATALGKELELEGLQSQERILASAESAVRDASSTALRAMMARCQQAKTSGPDSTPR